MRRERSSSSKGRSVRSSGKSNFKRSSASGERSGSKFKKREDSAGSSERGYKKKPSFSGGDKKPSFNRGPGSRSFTGNREERSTDSTGDRKKSYGKSASRSETGRYPKRKFEKSNVRGDSYKSKGPFTRDGEKRSSDSTGYKKREYGKSDSRSESRSYPKRNFDRKEDSKDSFKSKRPFARDGEKRSSDKTGFAKRPYGKSDSSPGTGRYLRRDVEKRDESVNPSEGKTDQINEREERSSEKTGFRKRIKKNDDGGFDKLSNQGFDKISNPSLDKLRNIGDDEPTDRNEENNERPKRSYERDTTDRKPFSREDDKKDFRKERPPFERKPFSKRPDDRGTSRSGPERSFERREPSGDSDRPKRWNRKEDHQFFGNRKKAKPNFPKTPDDGKTRLNKYISNAGICSRREADELIAAGVVSVNGEIVTEMGFKVGPDDVVKYNNEALRSERLVYILLNKPKDFITTTDDPEDRKTVMNLIAKACKERVYPVGRLDRNTTGILLFTNDGDLAKKLTHPSFETQKVYQVELDRALKSVDMQLIQDGLNLEDGFIKPDDVVYVTPDKKTIGVELHSGKNRIVRRIFEHLDYEVKKLDRVVFGGLTKKDLPRGRWRFLTELEIANLKMITGKRSAKSV